MSTTQQRKLGAIEAEVVVGEALATVAISAPMAMPTSPTEFEGWTAEAVLAWLEQVAVEHGNARAAVGLGLWVLRERVTEDLYGHAIERLALAFDVSATTLWRWRRAAQERFGLPEPKGSGRGVKPSHSAKALSAKSRNAIKDSPDDTLPREDQPADGTAEKAAEHARGTSPSHAGSASARGARGPANKRVAPDQGPDGNGSAEPGGVSPSAPQEPPATNSKAEQIDAIFDRFFASDPRAVALLSDVKAGTARARAARKWVDAYEMAVKGVAPLAPVTPADRPMVSPNFKATKK